jgi:hypothetical protein
MLGIRWEGVMSIIEDFVRSLEQRIVEIKEKHIKPLNSGMSITKGHIDVTKQEKESLERNIRSIEAVLAQYRDKV